VNSIREDELVYADDYASRMDEQEYVDVEVTNVDVTNVDMTFTEEQPETFENQNRLTQIQQSIYNEADDVIS